MEPPLQAHKVRRLRGREVGAKDEEDRVVTEEPLEIRVNGESVVVTMRTPGHDEELAVGFLHAEGVLRNARDVLSVRLLEDPVFVPRGNVVDVTIPPDRLARDPDRRLTLATSACGVCGHTSIERIRWHFHPLPPGFQVEAGLLSGLPDRMRKAQSVFEATGGLHAAALFDAKGRLVCLREDVGRHNAVDKIVGWAFRGGRVPLSDGVLLVSGRAGFEIVQKAVAAGIPVVAAVGAASSLAVRLADESGVALVGFLRGESANVYTHPERIRC